MGDHGELALVRGLGFLAESQAAISHNLANVNTAAYKRRTPRALPAHQTFDQELRSRLPSVTYSERLDWTQGGLRTTGNAFQMAIEGEGFFRVRTDRGDTLYTRNGSFRLDTEGRITTPEGHRFLDQNEQEIFVRAEDGGTPSSLDVAPNGTVTSPDGGAAWGPIGMFAVPDEQRLQPMGHGLYRDPAGPQQRPQLAAGATLRQGHQEESNVESLIELVNMIVLQRSYQATSDALNAIGNLQESFVGAMNR